MPNKPAVKHTLSHYDPFLQSYGRCNSLVRISKRCDVMLMMYIGHDCKRQAVQPTRRLSAAVRDCRPGCKDVVAQINILSILLTP